MQSRSSKRTFLASRKAVLRILKSRLQSSPPDQSDMRLRTRSKKHLAMLQGDLVFGSRLTNFLYAVQQFAVLRDVIFGVSQHLIACSVWMLVWMSLLVGIL